MRRIEIDPVTRIEGHARISLNLGEDGKVEQARFHVTQFRGFEKIAIGRPFQEMPGLMARTCGICPVSHQIAAGKAGDALLAVEIPEAAIRLRRVLHLAQLFQSHALSFFYLSAPDLLLGFDADPSKRNVLGLAKARPELVRQGVGFRAFGQGIIERLAGKRIHPAWVVPGGVSSPMNQETRDFILDGIPGALEGVQQTIDLLRGNLDHYREEIRSFANFPSLFMGLVGPEGELEHYHGKLRIVDAEGKLVREFEPSQYPRFIAEQDQTDSYMKAPFYQPLGDTAGMYRVGPLARLNVAERCGTRLADAALTTFRQEVAMTVHSSFHYHYARLIEMIHALEQLQELAPHPNILEPHVRAHAEPNRSEGIGVAEAPRGTLIHHYRIDAHGLVTWANLIIATGHNTLAMNQGILQVAQRFVNGNHLQEGMLNRVEAVIRAFDPCLSCASHAWGQMPLEICLLGQGGEVLDTLRRSNG